ncbi:hypothetical protein [Aphanothece sacrum]|uniref:Uncharacterized protein n=1 Tax=Aphanothece sacrum FPU1 TaxID=1920663 RepID=A0A401IIN3_APHSA|nr:hypothetical protein [Aphanothece sacrum]GBF81163.1 hypothetical protein AsFPU1_2575 [Aphanothece sacrum FPU1]GBF83489.1 transmembrane protein [Aphanothece sacrum FPU3]
MYFSQETPEVPDVRYLDNFSSLTHKRNIEGQCNESQQAQRNMAFAKAKRFVKNASQQGGVGPEAQPPSFQNPRQNANDLSEIQTDRATEFLMAVCPALSETTVKRRAQTLQSWLKIFLKYW